MPIDPKSLKTATHSRFSSSRERLYHIRQTTPKAKKIKFLNWIKSMKRLVCGPLIRRSKRVLVKTTNNTPSATNTVVKSQTFGNTAPLGDTPTLSPVKSANTGR